ncbi:Spermidine/putrescine-binding periplasmic protein [bacterium HR39]|nr:Spermidine/putrescine-binding periplasmic protein [bacterium HR39]
MRRRLVAALALAGLSALAATGVAQARDLTVVSWGGAYQDAQRKAIFDPYMQETGRKIVEDSWNGGIGALRAKAEGPPTWDVVQVETDELVLGCEEGVLTPLDWEKLGGKDRYIPEAVHECGVGNIVWATVLAYDGDRFRDDPPKSWADFFDTKTYPGQRALRRGPRQALEFALMADGVPLDRIYAVLRTPEGIERAFRKLDSIKGDLIWWEAGAQPPQLLASGEVVMTSAYNGRISAANRNEGRNFRIAWQAGYVYQIDSWVILANSDRKDEAMDFVAFASRPDRQAALAMLIPYGPTRVDAAELLPPEVAADIPGTPANRQYGLFFDRDFWVEHVEKLTERFNAWAAQ